MIAITIDAIRQAIITPRERIQTVGTMTMLGQAIGEMERCHAVQ
ncbi:MAG: hypothetical protein ACKOBH_03535 [bacterium]